VTSTAHTGLLLAVVSPLAPFPHSEPWPNEVKDGIPNVYFFGHLHLHNVLVIDLLGLSLEELFDGCGRTFTFKTVAMIATQLVRVVRVFSLLD
jgi:hypothetical protein